MTWSYPSLKAGHRSRRWFRPEARARVWSAREAASRLRVVLFVLACGWGLLGCGRLGFTLRDDVLDGGTCNDPDAGALDGALACDSCGGGGQAAGPGEICDPGVTHPPCPMICDATHECPQDCGGCGDGIVGVAETCDPPGSCPVAARCTQPSACIVASFVGDPALCTSRCVYEPVEACADGDGCCPPGCSASDDNDCSASCGNGVIEAAAGERCEEGTEQPCPENCDDGLSCTEDFQEGSASNCNVACTHVAIDMPRSEDGCCPAGVTSLLDSDCAPVCGNQALEAGETCDPCPASCADSEPCTVDAREGNVADCTAVCVHTPMTARVDGDACCPVGADATNDADCSSSCGNGVLESGEDCDGGELCHANCTFRFHPSLLHRYSFDGPATGSGSKVVGDSIGGKHGSISGDALDGDGKLTLAGGGSGGFVDLPDGLLSSLTDVTVEVWLSWRGGGDNQEIVDFGMNSAGTGQSSGSGTTFFFMSPAGLAGDFAACINATATVGDIAGSHRVDANGALPTNVTLQAVTTYRDLGASSRKTLKLYRNGVLVAGADNNVPATTDGYRNRLSSIDDRNVWLGRANYPVNRFQGTLFELRIYGVALTDSQISASFSAGPDPGP